MNQRSRPSGSRLGTVVAERTYTWHTARGPRDITVRLGVPVRDPHPGGDWLCAVEFAGAPVRSSLHRDARAVYGVDPFQALTLAIGYVRHRLEAFQRSGKGRLTWLDHEDLGVPDILALVGTRKTFRAPRARSTREATLRGSRMPY